MKKIENFETFGEVLPQGIYVVTIKNVIDHPEKEFLELYIDIAEGKFTNYFSNNTDSRNPETAGFRCYRFYKSNALYYFKRFIMSVEKSNTGYVWNWDEKSLIGKKAVVVLREEEYVGKEFEIKSKLSVYEWRSILAYRENKIEPPVKKVLTNEQRAEAERERQAHQELQESEQEQDMDYPF